MRICQARLSFAFFISLPLLQFDSGRCANLTLVAKKSCASTPV
jgi:hypothetical protein